MFYCVMDLPKSGVEIGWSGSYAKLRLCGFFSKFSPGIFTFTYNLLPVREFVVT